MGWGSASGIFNTVAQALIDADATDNLKRSVLAPLITELRDGDWDTCDESREEFADDPVIVELFVRELGTEFEDGFDSAYGNLDVEGDRWVLRCSTHGLVGDAEGTADGHDGLVRWWVDHDVAEHGGDGVVDPKFLINPGAVAA